MTVRKQAATRRAIHLAKQMGLSETEHRLRAYLRTGVGEHLWYCKTVIKGCIVLSPTPQHLADCKALYRLLRVAA